MAQLLSILFLPTYLRRNHKEEEMVLSQENCAFQDILSTCLSRLCHMANPPHKKGWEFKIPDDHIAIPNKIKVFLTRNGSVVGNNMASIFY